MKVVVKPKQETVNAVDFRGFYEMVTRDALVNNCGLFRFWCEYGKTHVDVGAKVYTIDGDWTPELLGQKTF